MVILKLWLQSLSPPTHSQILSVIHQKKITDDKFWNTFNIRYRFSNSFHPLPWPHRKLCVFIFSL